jgi:hypothetical protein
MESTNVPDILAYTGMVGVGFFPIIYAGIYIFRIFTILIPYSETKVP